MMSLDERIAQAEARYKAAEHQIRVQRRQEREAKEKAERLRNMKIGEMVCSCFPVLQQLRIGTEEENKILFGGLENILKELADNPAFHARLEAAITASPRDMCK